jgi:hypothetical protein
VFFHDGRVTRIRGVHGSAAARREKAARGG